MIHMRVKRLSELAQLPRRGSDGAAAYDLSAAVETSVVIEPSSSAIVPIGIAIEVPRGFVALIFSRSGQGFRHQVSLSNSVGVIDSDYRGEIKICLINHGPSPFVVQPGDRVAQMLLTKALELELVDSEQLSQTGRAEGGFGSTGNQQIIQTGTE